MGQDTDELRRDIESTRSDMSSTLDAIGDRVMPGRVVERNKNKVRASVASLRERVMGTAHDAESRLADTASSIGESASRSLDTVKHTPDAVRSQTRGAPLVTGGIAFGVGFLIAAAFPATAAEQHASEKVMDALEPVKDALTDAAREAGSNLKEPAKEATEALKAAASDGVHAVTSAAKDATEVTKDQARNSVEAVTSPTH